MSEMKDRINEFLDTKKITHPFLRETVTEFIEKHNEFFGEIVPIDELFKRLEENLDKITFAGKWKSSLKLGEYIKTNEELEEQNEILIYADETDLKNPEEDNEWFAIYTEETKQELWEEYYKRIKEIKNTIIHELVHCAYTKKMEYEKGTSHIFRDTVKDHLVALGRSARQSKLLNMGKGHFVEGIVNYISTKISGGGETYIYPTKAIRLLADRIGEEKIIGAAWKSEEKILKEAYITSVGKNREEGEKSYSSFEGFMKRLLKNEEEPDLARHSQVGDEVIENINQLLEGKMVSARKEFIEIEKIELKKIGESEKSEEKKELKNGLEDVANSDISKSWINRATEYIKNKYREIKAKITERENEEKG